MATPDSPSHSPSRSSTPNAINASRFTTQSSTAADLLASQTVGLVHLSDFRKRRAEALEQKEREAQDLCHRQLGASGGGGGASGTSTPSTDGTRTPSELQKKKKRKVTKGKLSFELDEEENIDEDWASVGATPVVGTPAGATPRENTPALPDTKGKDGEAEPTRRRLGPNTAISAPPIAMTRSVLLKETQTREQLRKDFLKMQEAARATDIAIPFVFYDGTNVPGGMCRVKKGDFVWLFLDKSRKVGAELGVGGSGEHANRREWARVGVDDLMLVRGEVIIPHHFDFYHFIVNKAVGPDGRLLFNYSATPQPVVEGEEITAHNPLTDPKTTSKKDEISDEQLEGFKDNPNITKVVDRRWYERNKHIFPSSVWEEYDPEKNYTTTVRRDTGGNAYFFT
ncbi:MAG: hypothetical protein M1829_004561 [Trizodia sp. TS-e1964]|nr:MAG: hypothetical protein M1829_004561 [Trizodia sp. TS-e1964]